MMAFASRESLPNLALQFLSFLFANLITFTVATQVYGDLFVLIILGTVAGFAVRLASSYPIHISHSSLGTYAAKAVTRHPKRQYSLQE